MTAWNELVDVFDRLFAPAAGEARIFFAPGRVNLIGEHTDYTGGYVLPASLRFGTWAIARPRNDGKFRLASTNFSQRIEFDESHITYREQDNWANYPKGMIQQLRTTGAKLSGADILFHGNIPNGAGLSSSASIELVTAIAVQSINHLTYPMIELVQLAQRAENHFVGVNCGIMDQFAVGMGKANHAILLKCDSLDYRYVPLMLGDYKLVITNSNKRRELADSKYNERRTECEQGFSVLKNHLASVSCLGDVTKEQWQEVGQSVKSKTVYNRLLHVVEENARVIASAQALQAGDLHSFGQLMLESHTSLRDLYEVTGVELDSLFAEACKSEGCIGTRMTGAGFGGCTVSLVHKDAISDFQSQLTQNYQAKMGLVPTFHICDIGDGAGEVTGEVQSCQF